MSKYISVSEIEAQLNHLHNFALHLLFSNIWDWLHTVHKYYKAIMTNFITFF